VSADIEKVFEVSYKLKQARKSIKFLFGDEYDKRIKPWKALITNVCKEYEISSLAAVLKLTKERTGGVFGDGMTQLVILSAACDLAEEK